MALSLSNLSSDNIYLVQYVLLISLLNKYLSLLYTLLLLSFFVFKPQHLISIFISSRQGGHNLEKFYKTQANSRKNIYPTKNVFF